MSGRRFGIVRKLEHAKAPLQRSITTTRRELLTYVAKYPGQTKVQIAVGLGWLFLHVEQVMRDPVVRRMLRKDGDRWLLAGTK